MSHRAIFLVSSSPALSPSPAALVLLIAPRARRRAERRDDVQEGAGAGSSPARRPTRPIVDLRRAANAYEAVVRRYPSSGYCDNALWQAAALMERAHGKSGAATDRDKAVELLDVAAAGVSAEQARRRGRREARRRSEPAATGDRRARRAAGSPAGSAAPAPTPVRRRSTDVQGPSARRRRPMPPMPATAPPVPHSRRCGVVGPRDHAGRAAARRPHHDRAQSGSRRF